MSMSANIDNALFPAVDDEFQEGPGQEEKVHLNLDVSNSTMTIISNYSSYL